MNHDRIKAEYDRIDAADQNAAVDARLNAEHERLERFRWETV